MADMMPKKSYDLTEITRLLLEMRENCIPKAGDAYEDPNRAEKHDALNAAIDLINNPSMISQWISVKDRLPEFRDWVLVIGKFVPEGYWTVPHIAEFRNGVWHSDDIDCTPLEERALTVTHWMPLPEPPKEEC